MLRKVVIISLVLVFIGSMNLIALVVSSPSDELLQDTGRDLIYKAAASWTMNKKCSGGLCQQDCATYKCNSWIANNIRFCHDEAK